MEGFILGLTNGTLCAAFCIPALISYLLKEGKKTEENFVILGKFLVGRFIGYLLFSVLAWLISITIFENATIKDTFFGIIFIVLAVLLTVYTLSSSMTVCGINTLKTRLTGVVLFFPAFVPVMVGFMTGLNICPPFLLVFSRATASGDLGQSIFFFLMFFLGTSLYFLPTPFLGLLNRFSRLKVLGKAAVIVLSVFYMFLGILMVAKGLGIKNLDFFEFYKHVILQKKSREGQNISC